MKEVFREREERSIPLEKETKVTIKNLYGGTKLKTWDRQELKINVTKAISGEISEAEAERKLKHVTLAERRTNGDIIIEATIPNFIIRPDLRFTIDLDISAPPYINIEIDTGLQRLNGTKREIATDISYKDGFSKEISNMRGKTTIFCGPADIEVKNYEGKISIHSLSGTVKLRNCVGEIGIQNESGDSYLSECSGFIVISAKSGNVFINDVEALNMDVKTSSGNIKAIFTPLSEGTYSLTTSSGYVKLKIPFHSSCYIKFETTCGKIFSEHPFELKERGALKLGDGKGSLTVRTSSGDIYLFHGFMEE